MSQVTNLIITLDAMENLNSIITKLHSFGDQDRPFNIVSVKDSSLPNDWYGGSKRLECNILIGAYNYLNLDDLITFMRTEINYNNPEVVQLIVNEQFDLKFRMIDLFPITLPDF